MSNITLTTPNHTYTFAPETKVITIADGDCIRLGNGAVTLQCGLSA